MRAELPERDWCSHMRDPQKSLVPLGCVSLQGKESVYEEGPHIKWCLDLGTSWPPEP